MVFGLLTGASNKFALMYTMANLLLLGSTMFLVGFKRQLANMFNENRVHASLAYLVSLALTVYCGLNVSCFRRDFQNSDDFVFCFSFHIGSLCFLC
jgi:hypothetical protein